jgi:(p)ppGpp synthase/HD superfamily hydrolase
VSKCPEEHLARTWMLGYRQGPRNERRRSAWEHPQDLVTLLGELPNQDPTTQDHLVRVAWLHDIIEDGDTGTGEPVTPDDLRKEGVAEAVIDDVVALTQDPKEDKPTYLARLHKASEKAKLVKCVDRICNLREGSRCFKDKRWARYIRETREYIIPLTQDLSESHRVWAIKLLEEAMVLRAVQEDTTMEQDDLKRQLQGACRNLEQSKTVIDNLREKNRVLCVAILDGWGDFYNVLEIIQEKDPELYELLHKPEFAECVRSGG